MTSRVLARLADAVEALTAELRAQRANGSLPAWGLRRAEVIVGALNRLLCTLTPPPVVKDHSDLTLYIGMSSCLANRIAYHGRRADILRAANAAGGALNLEVWLCGDDEQPAGAEAWLRDEYGYGPLNAKVISGRAQRPTGERLTWDHAIGPLAGLPYGGGVYRWSLRGSSITQTALAEAIARDVSRSLAALVVRCP